MTHKVFAFSDTHVGSITSSESQAQEEVIKRGIQQSDIVVIAGDAFENFTSTSTPQENLQLAMQTFARWHSYNEHAEFHFIPGNHEAPEDMIRVPGDEAIYEFWPKLKQYLEGMDRVTVHEKYCRIGDTVAAHGHHGVYKWEPPPTPLRLHTRDRLGGWAAPGTKVASFFFSLREVLPALHRMVKEELAKDGDAQPVNNLIFGHIHYAFFNKKLERPGLLLGTHVAHYNMGCSVAGRPVQLQPLCFELKGDMATGTTSHFEPAVEKFAKQDRRLSHLHKQARRVMSNEQTQWTKDAFPDLLPETSIRGGRA